MKNFFTLLCLLLTSLDLAAAEPLEMNLDRICKTPFDAEAILRNEADFVDDFLAIHCLMRMAKPSSVFEIGTCTGAGTLIIKNAVGTASIVYSLDLPPGESSYDLKRIGEQCTLPYVQLIGDSSSFDYQAYHPIDAWFIDGAHDFVHVLHETKQALLSNPNIIIWHDADISEVLDGIKEGLSKSSYLLYRIRNTRIAFAIPRSSVIEAIIHD